MNKKSFHLISHGIYNIYEWSTIYGILERVIITGGNGFIGRHLLKRLLTNKECSIVLVANTPNLVDRQLQETTPLTFYAADIRDSDAISNVFRDEEVDTCIHLAAKISVADSIRNPEETMDINVKGTLNVLEACHNSGVNNFVFASSAAVYGDVKELPISENQALRPLSPYGKSKMLAEHHVLSYNKLKKIENTISLRIFNVYGTGQTSESDVISKFAKRILNGLPPVIYGDGTHTRDYISVDDVADAILLSIRAMEEPKNNHNYSISSSPVFNIGTGKATSIKELAQKMISISGLKLDPIYEEGNLESGVILHSYANMTKAKNALHFVAKKSFETGLREIIEPVHAPTRVTQND
jgi:UDP-glucose 4-epimerase